MMAGERYTLNVAGRKFTIRRSLLQNFPETRLAKLSSSSEEYDNDTNEFYFDRNPKIMHNVLDLYRTGELHVPLSMCGAAVKRELEFWGLSDTMIAECCWKAFSVHLQDKVVQKIIKDTFKEEKKTHKELTLKDTIWLTLDNPRFSLLARIWNVTYFLFIALAIIVFCMFNEPHFRVRIPRNTTENVSTTADESTIDMLMHTLPNPYLYVIDNICLVFFTIEIVLRLAVCPSKTMFLKHPLNILDIFLIVVMWTVFVMDRFPEVAEESSSVKQVEAFLRLCFSLRIFRILHFGKRSKTMKILLLTFKSSARELSFLMLGLAMAVLISATLVFTAEMVLVAHTFDSLHNALWWALITMTTVGYGDYVPKSVLGQVVGSLSAVVGLLILSLPIAIIASNFNTFMINLTARDHRDDAKQAETPLRKKVKPTKPISSVTRLELSDYDP